ncbi:Toll/interleukin-1 receptor domain-containing protein [Tanacetum coccineum]|uniref:Toll/interleukin-1 receptor domain-containing protein n=1 Tax=Tanacetum coccineum TaxID=301880 RepID=A0ABQ5AE21_9ASTR
MKKSRFEESLKKASRNKKIGESKINRLGGIRSYAMEIFDACGFHPEIGIKVLIQKSLITIDPNERFGMHDLIQEMGHHIVRGEHPNTPEKHSRVWKDAEVSNMCFGDATVENDQIQAIEFRDNIHRSHVNMFISKMKKLRWLRLIGDNNDEAPNCLSNELRMQELLWKGYKHLPQLKVLHLVSLDRLVSTPDFNGLPRLQNLELNHCYELKEIHPSLGNHRSLKSVDVSFCYKLRMFPAIVRMEQLESLHIGGCDKSLVFPEIQANMECLVKLYVHDVQIDALLSSIGERCTNLIYLSLQHCFNLNSIEVQFDGLKCLKEFEGSKGPEKTPFPLRLTRTLRKFSSCWFEDGEIQSDIGEISNLEYLNLNTNRLYAGGRCRLPLPENWYNDFCGFLICAVLEVHVSNRWCYPIITITEEASDDKRGMFHDAVWGESFGGNLTWVWYVSFASLRRTEWWNPTHKNVSFYIDDNDSTSIGIGASLVPMNNGSGLTDTSTDSSEFTDHYTPKISIRHDSKSSLTISPRVYGS